MPRRDTSTKWVFPRCVLTFCRAVGAAAGAQRIPPVRVDILMGIPGVRFDQAWEHRNEIMFDKLVVRFISKDDLLKAKRAAGRPQDLIDAELLANSSSE